MGSRAILDKFEQEVWQRTGHNVHMVLREVVLAFVQEIGQYITAKIAKLGKPQGLEKSRKHKSRVVRRLLWHRQLEVLDRSALAELKRSSLTTGLH